ncbi:hypothetical protein LS684_21170 (plasmid) [Cytobacillus spongiae]|uniref:hypothetical protein n=1 Tax=Cytobacillus spongiae TaxID=2901381 RepID=UPI001F365CCB|nr:hypothetical protein [Cytobacillus spongiae]UII58136.1 hypothetical protein LS684_21170 [Cytobacillus spongiae]
MKQERLESLLMTIDRLGIVKIKHLQHIHKLGSYRNACKIINGLIDYTHQKYWNKEKIIYLNEKGRKLIDSEHSVTMSLNTEHYLLRNDIYIHFNCPQDWVVEYTIESVADAPSRSDIIIQGVKPSNKKKVITDAFFTRNGYAYLIEIDNKLNMADNRKKVQKYAEVLPLVRKDFQSVPVLHFFTTTENRRKKLVAWLKENSIRHEVNTFNKIDDKIH